MNPIFEILRIAIPVLALSFAGYLAWSKRELIRPALRFQVGRTIALRGTTLGWRNQIETVLVGSSIPDGGDAYFILPLALKAPFAAVKNVAVLLQYPASHAVFDLNVLKPDGLDDRLRFNDPDNREVAVAGDMASVCYEFPIVRIDEGLIWGDVLRFNVRADSRVRTESYWAARGMGGLYRRLAKIEGFVNALVIDVFIRSENHRPMRRTINVIWFEEATLKGLAERVRDVNNAFWRDCYPKPGRYLAPSIFHTSRDSSIEILSIDLLKVKGASDKPHYLCSSKTGDSATTSILLPPWDYRDDSAMTVRFGANHSPATRMKGGGKRASDVWRGAWTRAAEAVEEARQRMRW